MGGRTTSSLGIVALVLVSFFGFRPGLGLAGMTHSLDAVVTKRDELHEHDKSNEDVRTLCPEGGRGGGCL